MAGPFKLNRSLRIHIKHEGLPGSEWEDILHVYAFKCVVGNNLFKNDWELALEDVAMKTKRGVYMSDLEKLVFSDIAKAILDFVKHPSDGNKDVVLFYNRVCRI